MTSRAFFDPITLLRAAPLVSSTAALCFSYDQYFFLNNFLNNFLQPEHRDEANSLVPSYFATFFKRGLPQLLLFYRVSIGAGAANVWGKPNGASQWFAAGTALALAHFAFVPKIMWPVKALSDDEPKGQGNRELKRWLDIHTVRSLVADLPAWVCFSVAALASLQAV